MKRLLLFLSLIGAISSGAQTENLTGPVKISFHGLICNRPTNDDPLGGDGVSDEVSVDFWSWNPVTPNRAAYSGVHRVYGEDFLLPDRIKAGTATINGGIKAGDSYYREGVYDDNNLNSLSKYDIVNTFCSNNTLIAILPAIFEVDNGPLTSSPIQDLYIKTRHAFQDIDIQNAIRDFSDAYTYNDNNPYGFFLAGRHIGLDALYAGLFTANKNKLATRPIGLFSNWDYSSQLIVLTPKTIKIIAEKDYGYGKGILPVHFNEETMGNTEGHGNYIVLLKFLADIKDQNSPDNPSLRSVTVKLDNATLGEEYKFKLYAGAKQDSVVIRSPNTTATFTTKVLPGHPFSVVQASGPRTCRPTPENGVAGASNIIVTASCAGGSSTRKLSVVYDNSVMPVNARYELELNNGERIVLDSGHKQVFFSKQFSPGESFRIRQVGVPMAGNLAYNGKTDSVAQGIMGNHDIVVHITSASLLLSVIRMNITGVEPGETFKFSDNYGRVFSTPFSVNMLLGRFPVGDPLIIKQIGGPRPCVITYPDTVPPTPQLIPCNCSRNAGTDTSSSTGKLRGTFTSPPGTKIILQLNNSDELVLTQKPGPTTDAWQTMVFSFPKLYPVGTAYAVIIKSPNPGCVIYENTEGRVGDSTGIRIRCDKGIDLISRSTDNKILGTYYESFNPVIGGKHEDEGRYVAFGSSAKGIDGSTGKFRQIFWRDRKSGITKMISRTAAGEEGNGNSQMAAISADGKTVAFESYATNLSAGDNSWTRDVYAWNEQANTVELISKTPGGMGGNGESYEPVVSGDGSVIAYTSNASDIVNLGPVYSTPNVYIYSGGSSQFITKDYETGKAVTGYSPSISEDGNKVVFCAYNNRLVANDNNNLWDIFLWQSGMPGLKRISLTASGTERNQGTESASRVVAPAISGDGRYVAFATTASNMVPGDDNGMQDIFICNSSGGDVRMVSVSGNGDSPIGQGEKIGISYDGKWVSYNTNADNLGVTKGNIVLQNTSSGKTMPVTTITGGSTARPMLSRTGGYVIAGCSEKYDKRFPSSGLFVFYTGQ